MIPPVLAHCGQNGRALRTRVRRSGTTWAIVLNLSVGHFLPRSHPAAARRTPRSTEILPPHSSCDTPDTSGDTLSSSFRTPHSARRRNFPCGSTPNRSGGTTNSSRECGNTARRRGISRGKLVPDAKTPTKRPQTNVGRRCGDACFDRTSHGVGIRTRRRWGGTGDPAVLGGHRPPSLSKTSSPTERDALGQSKRRASRLPRASGPFHPDYQRSIACPLLITPWANLSHLPESSR